MSRFKYVIITCLAVAIARVSAQPENSVDKASSTSLVVRLMQAASRNAKMYGDKYSPVFSPSEELLFGPSAKIDINVFQKSTGLPVVVWTVNDASHMRELFHDRVDGIITDDPRVLRKVLQEEFPGGKTQKSDAQEYAKKFDVEGHAGARGLRPENTMPAYEAALDSLVTTIETDTGLTADRVSLIHHDPSFSADSCRLRDGTPYSVASLTLIKDVTMEQAQQRFICDKIIPESGEENDLALSPVAVAFATTHGIPSPYSPMSVDQMFEFVKFYERYYESGVGEKHPEASLRWKNAQKVRFNLETKIDPRPGHESETLGADDFVHALAGSVMRNHMASRSDIESFNFKTLLLVQEEYPEIQTVYLYVVVDLALLPLVPPELRP